MGVRAARAKGSNRMSSTRMRDWERRLRFQNMSAFLLKADICSLTRMIMIGRRGRAFGLDSSPARAART
jgi:hypothetical protein